MQNQSLLLATNGEEFLVYVPAFQGYVLVTFYIF